MASLLPSDVVELIDKLFKWVNSDHEVSLGLAQLTEVTTLVDALDRIPQHLLTIERERLLEYLTAVNTLRSAVDAWHGADKNWQMGRIPGFGGHPVNLIRKVLATCRDAQPQPGTEELLFISGTAFRATLRLDISAASDALRNGEWKAATVLAGSVVEALLLYAILEAEPTSLQTAKSVAQSKGCDVSKSPEWWFLPTYIEVAASLKFISEDTAKAARITKDFRNLIHPGVSVRSGQTCDRGTGACQEE